MSLTGRQSLTRTGCKSGPGHLLSRVRTFRRLPINESSRAYRWRATRSECDLRLACCQRTAFAWRGRKRRAGVALRPGHRPASTGRGECSDAADRRSSAQAFVRRAAAGSRVQHACFRRGTRWRSRSPPGHAGPRRTHRLCRSPIVSVNVRRACGCPFTIRKRALPPADRHKGSLFERQVRCAASDHPQALLHHAAGTARNRLVLLPRSRQPPDAVLDRLGLGDEGNPQVLRAPLRPRH